MSSRTPSSALVLLPLTVLLSGCPFFTPPAQPVPPGIDRLGCERPSQSVALNKHQLEVAGLNIGKFALGKVDYRSQPELVKLITDASTDLLVVDYLVCVAKNRKDIDPNDPEQVHHIRIFLAFMQSKPTADQILEWQRRNPLPKKQGNLEISGPFHASDKDRVLPFNENDVFRPVTVINTGKGELTWWLEGFPTPYFYTELYDGRKTTLLPASDRTFSVSRTQFPPEKLKLYPFRIRGDTNQRVTVALTLMVRSNPGPYDRLKQQLLRILSAKASGSVPGDDVLVQLAKELISKEYPHESESLQYFAAAQLLFSLAEHSASVKAYKAAEQSNSELRKNSQYHYFLGISYYFAGDSTAASTHLTQVSKLMGRPIATATELYDQAVALGVPQPVITKNVWRMAALSLPSRPGYESLLRDLPDRVASATGGRVEVRTATGPLQPQKYLTGLREGELDLGVLVAAVHSIEVPLIRLGSLPGLFENVEGYWKVGNAFWFGALDKTLREKYGLVPLANGAFPPSVIFSTKPIRSLADLKGARIRITNPDVARLAANLGAKPTALAGGELHAALDRGVIDAAEMAAPQWYASGLSGVTRYAYDWRIGDLSPWVIVASRKSWNGVSEDVQRALSWEFVKLQVETLIAANEESQWALEFARQQGVAITTPSADEMAKIRDPKVLDDIYARWVDSNRQHGIDGYKILQEVKGWTRQVH